jgi:hypothetical protein
MASLDHMFICLHDLGVDTRPDAASSDYILPHKVSSLNLKVITTDSGIFNLYRYIQQTKDTGTDSTHIHRRSHSIHYPYVHCNQFNEN